MKSYKEVTEATGYKLYHEQFAYAIAEAKKYAIAHRFTIDEEEWASEIGSGPRKPSSNYTNKYSLTLFKDGKKSKKKLHIQVYNRGNTYDLNYELNVYIS